MKYENRRYVAGSLMIFLQYLMFKGYVEIMDVKSGMSKVSFLIFIFFYFMEDVYSFKSYLIWEELKKQTKSLIEYLIMVTFVAVTLDRIDTLWKFYLLGILAYIYSLLMVKVIRKYFYKNMQTNMVIVGTGNSAKELKEIIDKNSFTMYNFMGYLDADAVHREERVVDRNEIVGSYDNFNLKDVDALIIAMPDLTDREMDEIVDKIEGKVQKIKFVPKINRMYTFNPHIHDYDGVMLVSAKDNMNSRKRRILKRILDIIGGLVGLMILAPLYLIYGRKIKADGGPATFSHNRIGRDLKPFKMHKFRSMYVDAEARLEKMLAEDEKVREEFYTNFKLKEDPRITPVGNFLRRTSLDEFPQFLNVLKGEMSLVGPRPVVQKEVDMYYGTEMGRKVFQAKPGITGMWQANGRSDIEDYDERIALDLYYIRNWTVWLDIIILIKTVKNVLDRKGAY